MIPTSRGMARGPPDRQGSCPLVQPGGKRRGERFDMTFDVWAPLTIDTTGHMTRQQK